MLVVMLSMLMGMSWWGCPACLPRSCVGLALGRVATAALSEELLETQFLIP